jgi:hypothetical protein
MPAASARVRTSASTCEKNASVGGRGGESSDPGIGVEGEVGDDRVGVAIRARPNRHLVARGRQIRRQPRAEQEVVGEDVHQAQGLRS